MTDGKDNDIDFQEVNPFKITDDAILNFRKSTRKSASNNTKQKFERRSWHNNKLCVQKRIGSSLKRHTFVSTMIQTVTSELPCTSLGPKNDKPSKQQNPNLDDDKKSNNNSDIEKENDEVAKKNISLKKSQKTCPGDVPAIPKQILKHSSLIKSNQKFLSILKVKKESVSEFVAKKRAMLNLQMAINIKLNEIQKLEEKASMKNEALQRNEQTLEDDAKKFELFLKENDQKAHNAIRLYESEAKKKMEKSQQVKRLNQQLQIVQADLSKKTMVLEQCMKYKEFMDKLTPTEWFDEQYGIKKDRQMNRRKVRIAKRKKEWREKEKEKLLLARKTQLEAERKKLNNKNGIVRRKREMEFPSGDGSNGNLQDKLLEGNEPSFEDEEPLTSSDEDIPMYFEKPKQLLDIFSSLEENNLFLIQNTQEMEHSIHELLTKFESTKLTSDSTRHIMEQNITHLKSSIIDEKDKVISLQARNNANGVDPNGTSATSQFNDSKRNLLTTLQEKVTQIYHQKQQLESNKFNEAESNNNNNNEANNNTETAPNTLFMLSEIEKEISNVLHKIDKIPITYLRKAKKQKAKKRREHKREEQLAIQQTLREERNKKVMERSMQPPKKRTTKPASMI